MPLQAPLRELPRLIFGLGLDRSRKDPKPRAGSREIAGRLHAGTRHLQQQRRKVHPATEPNEPALPRTLRLIYKDEQGEASVSSSVADRTEFCGTSASRRAEFVESKIELGEKFFNEIINHPVPLDMNTLKALKRSSSASISTYGWFIGPSGSALRNRSLGGRSTASSAWTRPRRTIGVPLMIFARTACGS